MIRPADMAAAEARLPIREVSLREMLERMAHHKDHETFRWYQTSYVAQDGSVHASETLRVTFGQARMELRLDGNPSKEETDGDP